MPHLSSESSDIPIRRYPLRLVAKQYLQYLWSNRWIYCTIALLGMLVCFQFVDHERFFYYWDTANFYDLSLNMQQAFHVSVYRALRHVARSMSEDYNSAFAAPVLPFFEAFGNHRSVFIAASYLLFLFPTALFAGTVTSLAFPANRKRAALVGCLMFMCVPISWHSTLRGYPDCGGAMFVYAAVWIYLSRDNLLHWKDAVWLGALMGASILFRRHYIYGAAALSGSIAIDLLLRYRLDSESTLSLTLLRFRNLAISLFVCAALVTATAPKFVWRSLKMASGGYPSAYVAYQYTRTVSALEILRNNSLILVSFALLGYVAVRSWTGQNRTIRFVLLLAALWTFVWLGFVRQETSHYPHAIPLFVSLGLTCLWLKAETLSRSVRPIALSGISLLLALHFVYITSATRLSLWLDSHLPARVQPLNARPLVNPTYDDTVRLIDYLRQHTTPKDTVVVGASSDLLNPSLLTAAARASHRAEQLHIADTPQVDERDGLPTSQILAGDYILVAKPFQHHLESSHQRTVKVIVDMFEEHWPISRDFELLPDTLALNAPDGRIEIFVYKRLRKSSPETSSDTYERIVRYFRQSAPA